MKRLLSIVSFVIYSLAVFGQTIPPTPPIIPIQGISGPSNMGYFRYVGGSAAGYAWYGDWPDTTAANNAAYISQIAGMVIRTANKLYMRDTARLQWLDVGAGALNVLSTNSITLAGDGSTTNQLTANLRTSANSGNQIQIFPDGAFVAPAVQNGLISGGRVIWETGLTYTVTAATYAINGVIYNSPETSITLANADPTNGRIDGFVVTTSSTAIALTGTPSTDPQNPSYTASTQLPLTFVLVAAASTEPTYCRDSLYFPNNGQTYTNQVSNAGRINVTSTNNPYSVTQDVEFTLAQNGDQLRFLKGSTISISTYSVLIMKIRSKAVWASTSNISLRFYNTSTPLGIPVVVGDNTPYGFNSSNAATYQTVVIPLPNFGNVTGATDLLFTVTNTGANTIGFYLDNVELLGCNGAPVPTSGSFWNTTGNQEGRILYGGTLDNFPIQLVTNNVNALNVSTAGNLTLQKTTPGISFQLGTFAASDYFWQRNGTDLIVNTAGGYINKFTGNTIYSFGKTTGHIWNDSLGTFRMQLKPTTGELILGNNTNQASSLLTLNSTTQGLLPPRMTTTQKNAIASPATGLVVYDTTLGTYYYYNGAAWLPFGDQRLSSIIAATATNTINSADFKQEWQWNSLTATGFKLSSTSTAATANTQKLFEVALSGANATASQTTYGIYSSNTHTTASGTSFNMGIIGIASGGTFNYGVRGEGTQVGVYGLTAGSFGVGIFGSSSAASALGGAFENNSTTGVGIDVSTGGGIPITSRISATSTNTVIPNIELRRASTTVGANGIGQRIDFLAYSDNSTDRTTNQIISKLTTAADATRVSEFSITGVNNAVTATLFTLAGSGKTTLNKYGVGSFTAGTPVYTIQVDASGNLMEGTIGAGTGDVTKVGTPVNDQLGVWTGATTLEGDAALTFTGGALTVGLAGTTLGQLILAGNTAQTVTVRTLATAGNYTLTLPSTDGNAGEFLQTDGSGNLTFAASAGGGTVTTVSWTGGIVSIANPTTAPAFTIAGTSGGIPYFSGASTWASSAALAANAIVIGGGAGVAPSTITTASGIVTWIGTPSSANLRAALTDESGTGAAYFQSGDLGTPTAGVISTGVTLGDVTMNVTGTDATGDIYYRNSGGILTRLPIGTSGQILRTSAGLLPEWFTTTGTGTLTSLTINQPASGITVTNSGVAFTTTGVWTFALANDLLAAEGLATTGIIRRIATDVWTAGTLVSLTTEVTGTLPVANGGTGQTSYTNGQLLIGNGTTLTKATLTGTANQINVTNGVGSITLSMAFNPTEQTLTDAATTTWNATNGGNAVWTNNGTGRTLAFSNIVAGYSYTLRHIQGAGGSHTVTTWTNVRWANGTAPTLTTTAGATDMITFYALTTTTFVGYFTPNVQ